jgi:phosphoribosylglycinamide formyltransferase-1
MKNIILFASGSGTNAANIVSYFNSKPTAKVVAIFSNNPNAKVVERAKMLNVPTIVFDKEALSSGELFQKITSFNPDLIVLAGFLLKFPETIIASFPNKIINIHPSLLPEYGGKGMYGMKVHQAVLANKEIQTGITIHYVNEHYDEGEFIFQKAINIEECQTPEEIAQKIHELEHHYFPEVIEKLITQVGTPKTI